jgi:hypothetical protein
MYWLVFDNLTSDEKMLFSSCCHFIAFLSCSTFSNVYDCCIVNTQKKTSEEKKPKLQCNRNLLIFLLKKKNLDFFFISSELRVGWALLIHHQLSTKWASQ